MPDAADQPRRLADRRRVPRHGPRQRQFPPEAGELRLVERDPDRPPRLAAAPDGREDRIGHGRPGGRLALAGRRGARPRAEAAQQEGRDGRGDGQFRMNHDRDLTL